MKNKNRIIILGLISALVLCACGGNAGMKEYKSKDGWTVSYDKKMFSVNEGNGSVDFVYIGESAGTNMVEISYIPDKQPEEALAEITDTWGEDADISRIEGFFPGTTDKWGYWRTLDTPNEGSGLGETLIAGEYNGGVLLFEIVSHDSADDDTTVSDELSGIIDSITYENFEPQTIQTRMLANTMELEQEDVLKAVNMYTQALTLLDQYDHQSIAKPEGASPVYRITYEDCRKMVDHMEDTFKSDVFGVEKEPGKVAGILAAVYQDVFGGEVYPTLEEKAANLLYFMIKDHPFADGCKRIAASFFYKSSGGGQYTTSWAFLFRLRNCSISTDCRG